MEIQPIHNATLLVIAKVRRIMLELGEEIAIELIADSHYGMGPIERWIHQPLSSNGDLTPMQILQMPDGEDQLRQVIASTLKRGHPSSPAEEG